MTAARHTPEHKAATLEAAANADDDKPVRLHITPLTPALLKVYLAPSLLPLAQNISYHAVETFPEKGFGYVELPAMDAHKLKKKLNGSTLKGSKVRIEDAKPEKRKAIVEEAGAADEQPAKRAKKQKPRKEQGVLEGVELPAGRKVKRGWTEPPARGKKDKREKKDKRDKKEKKEQKQSKYTKEPELLFSTKLTPVAATESTRKDKSKDKKAKKDKKSNPREVVVHEFAQNTKQPSFLKSAPVPTEPKPAVEYINGKGWVDEDGNVVEAETGKARNRRALELVDSTSSEPTAKRKVSKAPESEPSTESNSKLAKKAKEKQATPPSSFESSGEESSVVSSSSEDDTAASDSESDATPAAATPNAPQMVLTPSSPADKKEVHPLEALFKRPKPPALTTPGANTSSTPSKGLAPINTSFSFFDGDNAEADTETAGNPATPFTQRDLEWRGLRSAAPTPDTAAIGRRFSFDWRKGSQEAEDEDEEDEVEAGKQLSNNTKANASVTHLPGLAEEEENADVASVQGNGDDEESEDEASRTTLAARKSKSGIEDSEGEKEESIFGKWFWENRGDNNRAWKKRRRDTLKAKRLRENRRMTGGARKVG